MNSSRDGYQYTAMRAKLEKRIETVVPPKLGLWVKTVTQAHWQLRRRDTVYSPVLVDIWPTVKKWRIIWPQPRTQKAEQGNWEQLIDSIGEVAKEFAASQETQQTNTPQQNAAKLPAAVGDKPPEFVPLANRPVRLTLSGEAEKFIRTMQTRQKPNIELIVSPGQMRVILTTTSSSESFLIAHDAADAFFEQAVKYRKLFRSEEPPAVNRNQKQED